MGTARGVVRGSAKDLILTCRGLPFVGGGGFLILNYRDLPCLFFFFFVGGGGGGGGGFL